MTYSNGRVAPSALRTVAPGVQLLTPVANAYKAMVLVGTSRGILIKPAPGVGSGYRSIAIQTLFYSAAHGDKDAQRKVQLSSSSTAAVAAPGYSSHGFGTAIDLLFSGSDHPNARHIELAEDYGFRRTIAGDPNHFGHDKRTGINGVQDADKVRILAAYLNSRHLHLPDGNPAPKTAAVESGTRGKVYWLLMQLAGRADSIYPAGYLLDGIPTRKDGRPSRTMALETHYWSVLTND